MPTRSMTGFGRGTASDESLGITAEISTVNRKQFDLVLSLPKALSPYESRLHRLVRDRIFRGHIALSIRLTGKGPSTVSEALLSEASACIQRLREIALKLGLPDDLTAASLLSLELPLQAESDTPFTEAQLPLLETAVTSALDALLAMREHEGLAMEADLRAHLATLHTLVGPIRERVPLVVSTHRDAMLRRLAEANFPLGPEEPAVVREIALYTDRCDISEELARLESHFQQADSLLSSPEPCGRSLDFLCQEFHREITTLGNKANDAAISAIVVRFKSELEALREQVQNIE